MLSFAVREMEDDLQKAIRGAYVIPTKPRSKRKWKKMKSIIILKRTEKNYKVKLLTPEALSQKISSLKYSRDYSFLFSEPVVRVSPAPPIPLLKDVSATTQGSKTKWFKTSAPEITSGNNGTVKSCAATIRGDEGYPCLNNKQRRRHCYQDYRGNRSSSMEATKEDMRGLFVGSKKLKGERVGPKLAILSGSGRDRPSRFSYVKFVQCTHCMNS